MDTVGPRWCTPGSVIPPCSCSLHFLRRLPCSCSLPFHQAQKKNDVTQKGDAVAPPYLPRPSQHSTGISKLSCPLSRREPADSSAVVCSAVLAVVVLFSLAVFRFVPSRVQTAFFLTNRVKSLADIRTRSRSLQGGGCPQRMLPRLHVALALGSPPPRNGDVVLRVLPGVSPF